MTKLKGQVLLVHRGDADSLYFEEGRKYKLSYLKQVFRKRLERCPHCSWPYEIFPGLILKDRDGNLLTTKFHVELVPYKPELPET